MEFYQQNIFQKLFKKSSTSKPQLIRFKNLSTAENLPNPVIEYPTIIEQEDVEYGFPEPILYYLKKNANPKLLLKLMKSSKRYFSFKEFPFFAVHFLKIEKRNWIFYDQKSDEIKTLDLQNLSKPLWITNGIECSTEQRTSVIGNLLSKTFICDVKYLRIVGRILTFHQFNVINSKKNIEYFTLYNSHVECCNGKIVSIDKILQCLPNVKTFLWFFTRTMISTITPKTTKKLIDSLNPSILQSFSLMNIPETFDFKLFSKFMKANPSIEFFLEFDNISIKFSKMLQTFVDKLIKNASKKYRPIRIHFPNQTVESHESLNFLYHLHSQQIV